MKNAATADLLTRRQLLATATATATAMVANAWAIPPAAARQPRDHSSTLPSAATPQATGSTFPALAPFDTLMADFIHQQQVPGAQLAVSHRGRLVYARGFGVADRSQPAPVQPTSLFRIASVSKPITAAAVVQWIERGKLSLDSRVFSLLGLAEPMDARWKQITIQQLLQHSGGWDRDISFDPMFDSVRIARTLNTQPPLQPAQIITYMLSQPLQFNPGKRFAYSNFGYCLLGRVIEKLSGQRYEASVQQQLLAPLGIHRMRLGHTALAQRAEGEVAYHAERNHRGEPITGRNREGVALPYGAWSLEAMDAHGGWLACAPDLVRFAAAFDNPGRRFLRADSIQALWRRRDLPPSLDASGRPLPFYYGLGWMVRDVGSGINTWHAGSLDGTSTLLVRRHDGLHWAVLFNARTTPDGKRLSDLIDPLLHQAANQVRHWPDIDLFTELR